MQLDEVLLLKLILSYTDLHLLADVLAIVILLLVVTFLDWMVVRSLLNAVVQREGVLLVRHADFVRLVMSFVLTAAVHYGLWSRTQFQHVY